MLSTAILQDDIVKGQVIGSDETGVRIEGENRWQWAGQLD